MKYNAYDGAYLQWLGYFFFGYFAFHFFLLRHFFGFFACELVVDVNVVLVVVLVVVVVVEVVVEVVVLTWYSFFCI